ncbi:MAG: hypothetical protein IKS85_03300 [Lachnospiraceae bacterium]|nr:hypothetical protein [Lachnospiraceae bacterium]
MEEKKIRDEELNLANGGCGTVNMIIGDPQCNCSGEPVDMVEIGTDPSGRIIYYQCSLCGASESVYR